jgi:hypothetical protein
MDEIGEGVLSEPNEIEEPFVREPMVCMLFSLAEAQSTGSLGEL